MNPRYITTLYVTICLTAENGEDWEAEIQVGIIDYMPYEECTHWYEGNEESIEYSILDRGGMTQDLIDKYSDAVDKYVLEVWHDYRKQQQEDAEVERYEQGLSLDEIDFY